MQDVGKLPNCLSMYKPSQIEGQFRCIYCGKIFSKQNALRIHLAGCKKRALRKELKIGERKFHIFMNPRRDVYLPLKEFAEKHQDEPKLFVGALEYLRCAGWVTEFVITREDDVEEK